MLNKIGYINLIDYEGLLNELKSLDRDSRIERYWKDTICEIQKEELNDKVKIYDCSELLVPNYYTKTAEQCYEKSLDIVNEIKKSEKHFKLFNQKFEIKYLDDDFVAFCYTSGRGTIIPKQYVDMELSRDYSLLTCSQINNLISNGEQSGNHLAIIGDKNQKQVQSDIEKAKNELETAEKKAKEELKAFQLEMYKKEQELREKQEQMLRELRDKVENMKDQIFILEINILALRSYFGETFSIAQVMKGNNAPEEQPLVLFQKFRYMDEDLSRLTATSDFSTKDTQIIDLFEKYGDLFVETFCPNTKCITFFKASKDNKYLSYSREDDVIEEFEYYHGDQIGMIIRNGDNVYLSFIDEEITLEDNLFMSDSTKDSEHGIKIGETKIRDKVVRPLLNRKLIFLIIQALLRNTNIFSSLKNEQVLNSSKIIFSNADSQIRYNKYPSFNEFFNANNGRGDIEIKEGDYIFVDEPHVGSKTESNYWGSGYREEHRSRGDKNTARDSIIKKGINKLNIVDKWQNGYYVSYKEGGTNYIRHIYSLEDELVKAGNPYEPKIEIKYYISCEREIDAFDYRRYDRWSGTYNNKKKFNNANLRIYGDEFMSIMWCNSNYAQQWIDSKDGGNGKNYVYFVKMLKDLRDFMLKREEKEFSEINKFVCYENNLANKDIVLEWKKQSNVRNFTEYQAKRFVKWLNQNQIK